MSIVTSQIEGLVASVDSSALASAHKLKHDGKDLVLTFESGKRYLVRFAEDHDILLRERWGYETMGRLGIPCPRIEKWVAQDFENKLLSLVELHIGRIPDPHPNTLFFMDLHLSNIIVYDQDEPKVAGFVDVAEMGVGWPMRDFTNWERWELLYGNRWVRQPILDAYGSIDMALYRPATLLRFSNEPNLFKGPIGDYIINVVESGDTMAFDLDKLPYP